MLQFSCKYLSNLLTAFCNQVPCVQAVNADLHVGVSYPAAKSIQVSKYCEKRTLFYIDVKMEEL